MPIQSSDPTVTAIIVLLVTAAIAAVVVFRRHRRTVRRQRSLGRLLDGADEMERLLHRTRERMQAMRAVVAGRVPADIGAQAQASLQSGPQVQDALRDVLQHRLWIQRYGDHASQAELDAACQALDRARARIAEELEQLERTGAELRDVTAAVVESAAREPAALRRGQPD